MMIQLYGYVLALIASVGLFFFQAHNTHEQWLKAQKEPELYRMNWNLTAITFFVIIAFGVRALLKARKLNKRMLENKRVFTTILEEQKERKKKEEAALAELRKKTLSEKQDNS